MPGFEKFDSAGIYIGNFKMFKNLYWKIQRKLTKKNFFKEEIYSLH